MQRPILATQSDYGTADGRAAALNGNILKIAPEADIYSVLDLYPEGGRAQRRQHDIQRAALLPGRNGLCFRGGGSY